MAESTVVSNEYEVLLFGWEEAVAAAVAVLPVFPVSTHNEIPKGHEECVVGPEVRMVSEVEFRRVE